MRKILFIFVFVLISCKDGGSGPSDNKEVDGIDKTGIWEASGNDTVICFTDSTAETVDSFSGLGAGESWRFVVNGNSVTESIADADCSVTTRFNMVVNADSVQFSNIELEANPSPCEITMNYSGLTGITSTTDQYTTGEQILDYEIPSLSSNDYFIVNAPGLETGSKLCILNFKKK